MKIAAPTPANPTTPPTTPPTIAPIFVELFFEVDRVEVGDEEANVDCAIEELLRPGVAATLGVVAVIDSYALRKSSSATEALT